MEHELIVVIVERGEAHKTVRAAVKTGAVGATIVYGHGTGEQVLSFFSKLRVEPAKEIILILVDAGKRPAVFNAVVKASQVEEGGKGIAFVLPVVALSGLGMHLVDPDE